MSDFVQSERPQSLDQTEPILETLNDSIVIADDSDQILFVNTVFEEMTGIPRRQIVGQNARQLYHQAEEFAFAQALNQKALEMGRAREEFFVPTKDGGRLPVVVSMRVLHCRDGRHFSIVTLTDISEQKRTEEKLRAAIAGLEKHKTEIEQDLAVAARVQQSLAPEPFLWGALRIDTFYRPAHTIGGDFGLVRPSKEENLNVLVCDVSGHGISSALVANRIYSETVMLLGNRAPLADVLRRLNSLVIRNIGVPGFFFTLAAARIDRGGRTMEFAGAGHPPAMIVQPGGEPRLLRSRSTILGILPDAVDADATLYRELEYGDRIVLYTDGLTDVFNSRGEMLKVAGLESFVRETALLPFGEMKQGILNRIAAWRDGPPVDDVSLVLVEVR
ncbi:MAG: SpoIIE family protein phosphatase [Candidatus Acidiferrales bacterium]